MQDDMMAGRVCILMAVYNGARDLPEQLTSFAAQNHATWCLIASDDGSNDTSVELLRGFADTQAAKGRQVTILQGPRRGLVANFLSMLAAVPDDAAWVALSDQDDVWLPGRLDRGITALGQLPADIPALYCSRTWIVDQDLQNRRLSADFRKPPGFRNALVQNIAAGNTILLNRTAVDLARAAMPEALSVPGLPAHDWWLYQIITGVGGTVIRDTEPTLLYRQHQANQIGANDGWRARAVRIRMLLNGRFRTWNSANIAALRASSGRLTPAHRAELEAFARMRARPLIRRIREFGGLRLYRQTAFGQAALWLALVLGRL